LPDVSQDVLFQSSELQTLQCTYRKEFQSEEHNIGIVVGAGTMVGSAGERIWFTHQLPGFVMECEVEVGEVERPSGLPPVQLLGHHKVLQVLVVRPDLAPMFCALDKVLPLLEGLNDRQHLLVVDLVVPLDGGQGLGEESDVTGCHFSSSKDTWERTAPIAKLELSALMWKGLVRSGEMRTGVEVTLPFSLVNAVRSASPQRQPESFQIRSKSGWACSKKSRMNHQ